MNAVEKKLAELSEAEKSAMYRRVFESVEGQLVLEDIRTLCHGHITSFVYGDPHMTSFNEGKRSVILGIDLMLEPEQKEEGK